jgi:hypothetical protein
MKSGLDRGEHVRNRQEPRSLLRWPSVTGISCRLGRDQPHPVGTVQKEFDESGLSFGQGWTEDEEDLAAIRESVGD